jgi:exo-beta-1,3-glucanase (GH17 family)
MRCTKLFMSHPRPFDSILMIRLALLFALVASVIVLFWYEMGRPIPLPPSPLAAGQKIDCLSYSPFHGDRAPFDKPLLVPDEQIESDLRELAKVTDCIRTYSAARAQGKITRIAAKLGLKVLQGIWIGRNLADNRREINAALLLARRYPGTIEAFIVGNETLLRGELSADRIKDYLEEVKRRSGLPVTYADVWEFWLRSPQLVSAADFVTVHILPYWEDEPVPASDAVAHVRDIREKVQESFPGKTILIGEVGWPSEGRMRAGARPSPANQALVLSGVVREARVHHWKVNLIEAFDQPWKRLLEGTVGGYWGLFDDTARQLKFRFGVPVSNYPEWRLEAGLGMGAAFLIFAGAWFFRREDLGERGWGKDLAVAAIALGAGLVFGWAALGLPMEPPEPGDRLRSAGMIGLSLLVPMIAAVAVMRKTPLPPIAVALNAPLHRRVDLWSLLLAILFAATLVAAIHVALGLVFDPRYKDFQLALLSGPVLALAIVALVKTAVRRAPGAAEWTAAALLAGSALFVMVHEGPANWQAQWFGGLLVVLALTALRAAPAPS